jgi:hypothetical protein
MGCQTEKWWQLLVMVDSNDNSRVRDYFSNKSASKIVVLNNEFLGMVRQWQLFFIKICINGDD